MFVYKQHILGETLPSGNCIKPAALHVSPRLHVFYIFQLRDTFLTFQITPDCLSSGISAGFISHRWGGCFTWVPKGDLWGLTVYFIVVYNLVNLHPKKKNINQQMKCGGFCLNWWTGMMSCWEEETSCELNMGKKVSIHLLEFVCSLDDEIHLKFVFPAGSVGTWGGGCEDPSGHQGFERSHIAESQQRDFGCMSVFTDYGRFWFTRDTEAEPGWPFFWLLGI